MLKSFLLTLLEKKARTLLVLLSIAASVALIFITIGISNTATDSFYTIAKQWAGNSDVVLTTRDEVGSSSFLPSGMIATSGDVKYVAEAISCYGYLDAGDQSRALTVFGMDYDDLSKYNPIEYAGDAQNAIGKQDIVISSRMAKDYGYQKGDVITVQINKQKVDLTICGIAKNSGMFVIENSQYVTAVNKQLLEELFDAAGKCNVIYLGLQDPRKKADKIELLQSLYPQANVSEAFSESEVASNATITTRPFYLSSIFIIVMGIFIIYSSFQLIMAARIKIIGTFRSVGATKEKVKRTLLLESLLFGLAGGVLGCVLGSLFMSKVIEIYAKTTEISVGVRFTALQFVISILFGVVLTIVSTYLPIKRTGKLQIKEIILELDSSKKRRKSSKGIVPIVACIIIMIACQVVPRVLGVSGLSLYFDIVCMVLTLVTCVILVSNVFRLIGNGALKDQEKLCASFGLRNINDNKNLVNVMKLMVIAVSCVILIRGMTASISYSLTTVYADYYNYDFMMEHRAADAAVVEQIKKCNGVKDAIGWNYLSSVYLPEYGGYVSMVYGVDDSVFFDYMKAEGSDKIKAEIDSLADGRKIILTEVLSGTLGLNTGDKIQLELGDNEYEYTVAGVVDCSINLGNMAYISSERMREDAGMNFYSALFIRTSGDNAIARNAIMSEFQEDVYYLESFDDIQKKNYDNVLTIFNLLSSYALATLLIGIIGVVNNIVISFMERKKEFAIYRSLGMELAKIKKMLFYEALYVALTGMGIAIGCGLLMLSVAPYMLKTIFGNIVLVWQPLEYVIYLAGGALVMIILGLISAGRVKKNSIVSQLKYE